MNCLEDSKTGWEAQKYFEKVQIIQKLKSM